MTSSLGHVVDIHNDPSSVNSTYRLYPNGSMSEDGYMFKGEKFSNLDDFFRSDAYKENLWQGYQLALPQQLNLRGLSLILEISEIEMRDKKSSTCKQSGLKVISLISEICL